MLKSSETKCDTLGTGIWLSGLPKKIADKHLSQIEFSICKRYKSHNSRQKDLATVVITFKMPEEKGFLTIDLKARPQNKDLIKLLHYMDASIICFGKQHNTHFYVQALYPREESSNISNKAFFFFLSAIGIDYFHYPSWLTTNASEATIEDIKDDYRFYYHLKRDSYPVGIQNYLDAHIGKYEFRKEVQQFLFMDWSTPVLDLPSSKEAKAILDETVYGMEEVKERLLEFLEVVRRSGNLARNLLLVGPPGTGKTTIMQAVSKILRLPMSVVPMSACVDLEAFVGMARGYTGAKEGLLTTAVFSPTLFLPDGTHKTVHQIAQLLFLNELDKAVTGGVGHKGNVLPTLLRMTDDNRSFFDVYHEAHIDLSNIVIVADANDTSGILPPLLDRFEVIEIPPPTDEEKAVIFQQFSFPKALREHNVSPAEVTVSTDAVSLITTAAKSAGVREMNRVADRIIGNYLLHHSKENGIVTYSPEMIAPFLEHTNTTTFVAQPGNIRSVVFKDYNVYNVAVQSVVTPSKERGIHVYGITDPLVRQELEAAVTCACNHLCTNQIDVTVQVCGIDDHIPGQLGLPVFVSVLSAAYRLIVKGVFYGGTTLLGGLTCHTCNSPDLVATHLEHIGENRLYTATGFTKMMVKKHKVEICECLDAKTLALLLFGTKRRMNNE